MKRNKFEARLQHLARGLVFVVSECAHGDIGADLTRLPLAQHWPALYHPGKFRVWLKIRRIEEAIAAQIAAEEAHIGALGWANLLGSPHLSLVLGREEDDRASDRITAAAGSLCQLGHIFWLGR